MSCLSETQILLSISRVIVTLKSTQEIMKLPTIVRGTSLVFDFLESNAQESFQCGQGFSVFCFVFLRIQVTVGDMIDQSILLSPFCFEN